MDKLQEIVMEKKRQQETKGSKLYYELGEFRKAANLGKSGINAQFRNKDAPRGTSYVKLEDVLTALENLIDHGLGFEQHIHKGMLITTVFHLETGESFSSDMELCPDRPGPQALASCVTYYRRISLMTMFGLNAEDDDGNMASSDVGTSRSAGATPAGPSHSSDGSAGTIDDDFLA